VVRIFTHPITSILSKASAYCTLQYYFSATEIQNNCHQILFDNKTRPPCDNIINVFALDRLILNVYT